MISKVAKVYLPVDDQSDALAFWTDRVGFQTVQDAAFGDERWIEVKPPGQELLLVLTRRGRDDEPRQDAPARLPHSNVMFDCDDIEATYAELTARGVVFSLPPERQHFGWWSLFEDAEGTRFALGQWG